MSATYIWANIRALLVAGFTEDELRQFCFDTPEFKPLYPQLARSSSAADIADQLIEYADQKLKTELLLVWAAEKNLARFEEHQPYYTPLIKDKYQTGAGSDPFSDTDGAPNLPLSAAERASLQRQLKNLRENLRWIDERIAEYVLPTDVPLTLLKDRARVQQQVEELTQQLGKAT